MPTELRKWAWMTGVAGNGEVKSDYRDSYPDQRREGSLCANMGETLA